eukprot:TRINITY_DN12353_c0_g1_i2.p1 TRINITY_DN12353_c0_g1~~TRINITY_DN12353_c0_g1_i2.p1  ORF type:complete len:105 (-),score=41.38 TRINITY_DN12353_c0_g1_i2:81-395(-)
MIRRPPRSTQGVSSAASDVYKRQTQSTWVVKLGLQEALSSAPQKKLDEEYETEEKKEEAQGQTKSSPLHLSLIHISEPTRPLYISYAVFCLKKKKKKIPLQAHY